MLIKRQQKQRGEDKHLNKVRRLSPNNRDLKWNKKQQGKQNKCKM